MEDETLRTQTDEFIFQLSLQQWDKFFEDQNYTIDKIIDKGIELNNHYKKIIESERFTNLIKKNILDIGDLKFSDYYIKKSIWPFYMGSTNYDKLTKFLILSDENPHLKEEIYNFLLFYTTGGYNKQFGEKDDQINVIINESEVNKNEKYKSFKNNKSPYLKKELAFFATGGFEPENLKIKEIINLFNTKIKNFTKESEKVNTITINIPMTGIELSEIIDEFKKATAQKGMTEQTLNQIGELNKKIEESQKVIDEQSAEKEKIMELVNSVKIDLKENKNTISKLQSTLRELRAKKT